MQHWRVRSRVLLRTTVVWELLDKLDMSHLMRGERSPSPRVRRRLQEVLGVVGFHILFYIQEVDG